MKFWEFFLVLSFCAIGRVTWAQEGCTVYTDTMYLVAVVESEDVLSPRKTIMEPNMGMFWIKDLNKIVLDTSGYTDFFNVFFSNGIIANDLLHDIEKSYWSACAPYNSKEYRNSMFKDFINKEAKLNKRMKKKTHCNIRKAQFYSYEFKDTIVADVSILIYVGKVIIDYYVVPYERNESTVDFQYDYNLYPHKYQYRLKQIKKVLRVKGDETLKIK